MKDAILAKFREQMSLPAFLPDCFVSVLARHGIGASGWRQGAVDEGSGVRFVLDSESTRERELLFNTQTGETAYRYTRLGKDAYSQRRFASDGTLLEQISTTYYGDPALSVGVRSRVVHVTRPVDTLQGDCLYYMTVRYQSREQRENGSEVENALSVVPEISLGYSGEVIRLDDREYEDRYHRLHLVDTFNTHHLRSFPIKPQVRNHAEMHALSPIALDSDVLVIPTLFERESLYPIAIGWEQTIGMVKPRVV